MLCRQCGTQIADKAIVCYRCGAATTDPVRQPVRLQGRRSPLLGLVVIALLVVLALFMGQASRTAAEPTLYRTIAGVLLGAALILLIVRIARRRR
jgi:hypothetical protein